MRILRWLLVGMIFKRFKWLVVAIAGLALVRKLNGDRNGDEFS